MSGRAASSALCHMQSNKFVWSCYPRTRLSTYVRSHCYCSDLPALLDEWAGSLFRELDYRREAANGTRFKASTFLSVNPLG